MSKVETQAEADKLNETEVYGPYRAANGHIMVASLLWPKTGETETWANGTKHSLERDYQIGDEIRYTTWDASCAPECNHRELGGLEDW